MKNLWQEEREVVNHTYINHYFKQLIFRDKFREVIETEAYESREVQEVTKNFINIKQRVEHLLSWANPYAMNIPQIAEMSHLYHIERTKEIAEFFEKQEHRYKDLYQTLIFPKVKQTNLALSKVEQYINQLEQSDTINSGFVEDLRIATDMLYESLKAFKDLSPNEVTKSTILVIDDHYAVDSSLSEFTHYDKNCFLEDYSSDTFEFIFCSGFDSKVKEYNTLAVQEYMQSLDVLPSIILLDIMFGDEEYLGVEILEFLAQNYPTVSVVIMTSKQKSELFDKTLSFGAVDYLVKPLNRKELHTTLYRYTPPNRQHALIGQEDTFLSIVNEVVTSKENLLITTEDTQRARYIFEYSAKVRGKGLNIIDIENETSLETLHREIKLNSLNLFLNIDKYSITSQKKLYSTIQTFDEKTTFGAICSSQIVRRIKQHSFHYDIYRFFAKTHVRLELIKTDSDDLLLLFRYYFNLLKPKNIESSVVFNSDFIGQTFSYREYLSLNELLEFLGRLFIEEVPLNNKSILEYIETNYIQESYDELHEHLETLRVEEFEILLKALKKTQLDGSKSNKSLAISNLMGIPHMSTNNYDRWIKKVWKDIPIVKKNEYKNLGYLNNLGIRL